MKTESEASFGYPVMPKGKNNKRKYPFRYPLISPIRRDNNKEIPFRYPLISQKRRDNKIRKYPLGIP
jgi:hypothetical protein